MKRWQLLHVGPNRWVHTPERIEIPLDVTPGPDTIAYVVPGLLILRSVGGLESKQEVYGLDLYTGALLWTFSDTDPDLIFFSCDVDADWAIATTRTAVYRLLPEGPVCLFSGSLGAASTGRVVPDRTRGYVLDEEGRLIAFDLSTEDAPSTSDVIWSRRPPKTFRFQNPFPMSDGGVCLSVGSEVRRILPNGETLWRWSGNEELQESYAIERFVRPHLLLIRVTSSLQSRHCTIDVKTGEECHSLGDVWSSGADGVTDFPVIVFDGEHESMAFLQRDGSRTELQKMKRMFRGFGTLPSEYAALYYDALLRFVVCVDAAGKVIWKHPYPGGMMSLSASVFMPDTAFFATGQGSLHVWDVGE